MKKMVLVRLALLLSIAVAGILIGRNSQWTPLAQARAGTYKMDQKNTAFVPQRLIVPRGATVIFENHDSTEHNVTLAVPQGDRILDKDLGDFPPGLKISYIDSSSPAIVRVHCNIHQEMTATIVVR